MQIRNKKFSGIVVAVMTNSAETTKKSSVDALIVQKFRTLYEHVSHRNLNIKKTF